MKEEKEALQLKGLAQNDRKAIESIYRDHFNLIQSLVVKNGGSADDAKDIFQEAMIVLYEKSKSEAFSLNCGIGTYLYSVSRRLWLKRLMQQSRFLLVEESDGELASVETDLGAQDQRNTEFLMMEKAMGSLGEPCKSLLEAFYLKKQGMQEIALSFGYTNADNAKTQKYKCLTRLKKAFFAQYNNSQP